LVLISIFQPDYLSAFGRRCAKCNDFVLDGISTGPFAC
jgi:hypothetical protein